MKTTNDKKPITPKKSLLMAGVWSVLAVSAMALGGMPVSANNDTANAGTVWQKVQNRLSTQVGVGLRGEWRQWKGMGIKNGLWIQRGMWKWVTRGMATQNTAIREAVMAGDYNAFVKAWSETEHKRQNATLPTQDQFNQMAMQAKQRQSIQTAIANKDYNAFVKAWNETEHKRADASLPTQDQFNQIAAKYKQIQ